MPAYGKDKSTSLAYAALLRGINVGGNNKLPMKDLASLFLKAGCGEVSTYIQSGNVVFKAEKALVDRIPGLMNKAVLKSFGIDIPFIVRSAVELKKIANRNPFLKRGIELETLHVGFLADRPDKTAIALLDPQRSVPDEFEVIDGEIYFCFKNGAGKTKLTNQYFDSKLKTITTLRNWNTVLKLVEMTDSIS